MRRSYIPRVFDNASTLPSSNNWPYPSLSSFAQKFQPKEPSVTEFEKFANPNPSEPPAIPTPLQAEPIREASIQTNDGAQNRADKLHVTPLPRAPTTATSSIINEEEITRSKRVPPVPFTSEHVSSNQQSTPIGPEAKRFSGLLNGYLKNRRISEITIEDNDDDYEDIESDEDTVEPSVLEHGANNALGQREEDPFPSEKKLKHKIHYGRRFAQKFKAATSAKQNTVELETDQSFLKAPLDTTADDSEVHEEESTR